MSTRAVPPRGFCDGKGESAVRQGSGSLAGDRSRGKKHHPAAVGTRAADGDGASESFGGEGGQIGAGGRLPVVRANTPQTATAPRTNRPGLRVLNSSRPARAPFIASSEAVSRNNGECSSVRLRASAASIVCDDAHEVRSPCAGRTRCATASAREPRFAEAETSA